MNDEKYVLACLKRWLVDEIRKDDDYGWRKDYLSEVAIKISELESDAVIGSPDTDEIEKIMSEEVQ